MSNDRPEKTRQKIYEEYEDSLFKLVMHDVAQQEGRLFQEEAKKMQNDSEYQPSQEAVQNFSRQIGAMNDRMFMIQGKIDKETSIKMAEGVKYVD
ncbi:MAG: hypothetical protein WC147_06895 [Syntrophomonas sp.]|jgi:hypothetical protein